MNKYSKSIAVNWLPQMLASSRGGFRRGTPRLSFIVFLLMTAGAQSGTWSSERWRDEGELPHPDLGRVTHAIAFGLDSEPPAPAPFEITDKITGENWAVFRLPDHTTSVAVSRRPEHLVVKMPGNGSVLIRGRIFPKGKSGGLAFELSGLTPGLKYNFVLFGLCLMGSEPPEGSLVNASASDAPDQSETLNAEWKDTRLYVYEYVSPPNGQITISLGNIEANQKIGGVRCCAFLNYRIN